jgi:Flp pilus assembly protein TadB
MTSIIIFFSVWALVVMFAILFGYCHGKQVAETETKRIQTRNLERGSSRQNQRRKRSLSPKDAKTIDPAKEYRQNRQRQEFKISKGTEEKNNDKDLKIEMEDDDD